MQLDKKTLALVAGAALVGAIIGGGIGGAIGSLEGHEHGGRERMGFGEERGFNSESDRETNDSGNDLKDQIVPDATSTSQIKNR